MSSLLVIGGSGFLGKSILDAYQRGLLENWNIKSLIILARNAEILKLNPELINSTVTLINDDIASCNYLPYADYVIHAAASADAKKYYASPDKEMINIEDSANNYCHLAKRYHKNSKILYVSSGAVYGHQPSNMEEISENYLFKKDVSNLPLNKRGYALAKRNSESRFAELGKENLSLSIARCFTFVGKYLPLDKHFAIGNFIKNGIEGKPVIVNARNPVIRSYMYADDLVLWLMNIISISNINVPIYNVGSNQEISILELAKLIGNKTKQQVLAQEIIYPAVDRYIPSIEKAQKELNLNLSFNIEQSIDSTLNALLN